MHCAGKNVPLRRNPGHGVDLKKKQNPVKLGNQAPKQASPVSAKGSGCVDSPPVKDLTPLKKP